jgi:hypothetical protein
VPESNTGALAQFGSFIFDQDSEPARIFAGGPNAVQIHYTAGYSADGSAVPGTCKAAMMQLVGGWYENRDRMLRATTQDSRPHRAFAVDHARD